MIRSFAIGASLLCVPAVAAAGGLGSRPNPISARGEGMGGAFTAFADDATALFFNPAGLDQAAPQVDVGGELVYASRTYTPNNTADNSPQKGTLLQPVPTLGVLGRFDSEDGRPSKVTFGAGLWNTYGGKLAFPRTGQPAIDSAQDFVIEGTAGAAVHVSDKLAFGASLRVGLGFFSIDATQKPFDATLSANGVGIGTAAGVLYRPIDELVIGVAWRSPLKVSTTGSGSVTQIDTPQTTTVSHVQYWPQSASLGIGIHPTSALKLAAQLDWTAWSVVDKIVVNIEALGNAGIQTFPEYWKDTWTARAGADVQVTPEVALRGGAYYETNAVPDRVIERQYLDTNKFGVAAGMTYTFGSFRIDAAVDAVLPSTRTVNDNTADTTSFPADRNIAPGKYEAAYYTLALSGAYRF